MKFTVVEADGYVKVLRGAETICAGVPVTVAHGQRQLRNIEFTEVRFQKSNRTRQTAMKALQTAGWR